MKKLIFLFATLLALGACEEKSQPTAVIVSDADSIYTYDFIKMHFVKEPERSVSRAYRYCRDEGDDDPGQL